MCPCRVCRGGERHERRRSLDYAGGEDCVRVSSSTLVSRFWIFTLATHEAWIFFLFCFSSASEFSACLTGEYGWGCPRPFTLSFCSQRPRAREKKKALLF